MVDLETGEVIGGDAGDEGVVALAAAFVNQMGHQKRADSFMAGFGSEINRGLKGL